MTTGAEPTSSSSLAFAEVRRLGARAAEAPEHPDAFGGRAGQWSLWIGGVPGPDPDALLAEFARALDPLRAWSSGRSMPNFLISDDPAEMTRLWDRHAYERLQRLADRYDPDRVLAVGQVVARA